MFREMSCWTLFTKQFYISSVFGSWFIYKMFPSLFRTLLTLPDKNIFCSQSRALFLHKGYMLLSFFIHFLFRPRQFTTLIERVPWASQSRKWVSSIFLFFCLHNGWHTGVQFWTVNFYWVTTQTKILPPTHLFSDRNRWPRTQPKYAAESIKCHQELWVITIDLGVW